MGRALPSPSQSTPPEVDPESLEDGDRVVIRAERHGSGRPIEIIGTARPEHERPEVVVEETDPDWTWLLDESGQLFAHEGSAWRRLIGENWSLHRLPATDGGRQFRGEDDWTLPGGQGLPPKGAQAAEGDGNVWLFTCCDCGRRWADPPGPVTGCSCGSDKVVCHRIDHARYSRIRWYSDPRKPETPDEEELVTDGGEPARPITTVGSAVVWYHEEGGRVKHEGGVDIYSNWVKLHGPMSQWIPRERVEGVLRR